MDFALTAVFLHSGQVCSAGSRLIVQEEIHDRFVDALVRAAEATTYGPPENVEATYGPLNSSEHLANSWKVCRRNLGQARRMLTTHDLPLRF